MHILHIVHIVHVLYMLVLIGQFDERFSGFFMYLYMGYLPNEPIHDEE
jgi:hypothetical protein